MGEEFTRSRESREGKIGNWGQGEHKSSLLPCRMDSSYLCPMIIIISYEPKGRVVQFTFLLFRAVTQLHRTLSIHWLKETLFTL